MQRLAQDSFGSAESVKSKVCSLLTLTQDLPLEIISLSTSGFLWPITTNINFISPQTGRLSVHSKCMNGNYGGRNPHTSCPGNYSATSYWQSVARVCLNTIYKAQIQSFGASDARECIDTGESPVRFPGLEEKVGISSSAHLRLGLRKVQ